MNNEYNENHFYELVAKIQPLSQNECQAELEKIRPKVDQQETRNIKPKIASFQEASVEIHNIETTLSDNIIISDKVNELNEKSSKIFQFFSKNEETLNKIQELKVKRDFSRSLGIFSSIPSEILKEVKDHNYLLATKYLLSMMKFFSDPKYNCQYFNSVKQQFSEEYISELNSYVEYDMFIHTDENKSIQQSIQAVGFQISLKYLNVADLNNPTVQIDNNLRTNSIMLILKSYFNSWTNSLFTEESSEISNHFLKAGKTLLLIDNEIQNYILKLPYFNLTEKSQNQDYNDTLKKEIIIYSKKFYLSIYKKYVDFSNFNGFFYTKTGLFDANQISSFKEQYNATKIINETWGKLVSNPMNMSSIVLLNGILDLKEKCQMSEINTENIYELLCKFFNLTLLNRDIQTKKNVLDFSFLKKIFQNYHTNFIFDPSKEKKFKTTFITFIQFNLLFRSTPATQEISDIISNNFFTQIVSALSNLIITNSMKGASVQMTFTQIEMILKNVYNDSPENTQTKTNKTFIDLMENNIRKSNFNLYSVLNMIIFQTLSGITNHYLWEILDAPKLEKIKCQELVVAEWYLSFLKKDIKAAPNMIKPYINLLSCRLIKNPHV